MLILFTIIILCYNVLMLITLSFPIINIINHY